MANHWIVKAGEIAMDTLADETYRLRRQHRAVAPGAPLRNTAWLHEALHWCLHHRGLRGKLLTLMGVYSGTTLEDERTAVDRFCRPETIGQLAAVVRVLARAVPRDDYFWIPGGL